MEGLDRALRDLRSLPGDAAEGWREYTVSVMRAAGDLGDHAQVWDLYQRWLPHHNAAHAHYLGGVAAYNRGRWSSADRAWDRIGEKEWLFFIDAFRALLPVFETRLITAPPLPYAVPHFGALFTTAEDEGIVRLARLGSQTGPVDDGDAAWAARTVEDVHHWLLFLGWALTAETPAPAQDSGVAPEYVRAEFLRVLVRFGGERGRKLAEEVFSASAVPLSLKMAAGAALAQAGAIEGNRPVRMMVYGIPRDVHIVESVAVIADDELETRYQEGLAARDAGRIEQAKEILGMLADFEREVFYLPAVIAYANLLRCEGLFGRARQLLDLAERAVPEEPVVLFNKAALCLQVGDPSGARNYLKRIRGPLPPQFKDKLRDLKERVSWAAALHRAAESARKRGRNPLVERPVPAVADLSKALRVLPVGWLDACASIHGVATPGARRAEKEVLLLAHLRDDPAGVLQRALDTDPTGDLPDLLIYLCQRGGSAPLVDVTKRFPQDDPPTCGEESISPQPPWDTLAAQDLSTPGLRKVGGPWRGSPLRCCRCVNPLLPLRSDGIRQSGDLHRWESGVKMASAALLPHCGNDRGRGFGWLERPASFDGRPGRGRLHRAVGRRPDQARAGSGLRTGLKRPAAGFIPH